MRTKNLYRILILLVLGLSISCESFLNGDQVQIRIQNISDFEYSDVKVNTSGGENIYGTIAPKSHSAYMTFDLAYRYAFVELKIASDTFTLQPIDYVGEDPLKSGKYTYAVDATEEGGKYERLSLVLFED